MAVVIRLKKFGSKNRHTYRLVAAEKRSKSNGKVIDQMGSYNPLVKPPEIKINQKKISMWIKFGAQLSPRVKKIISQ